MANHSIFGRSSHLSLHKISFHLPILESLAFSPVFLCGICIALFQQNLANISWQRILISYFVVHGLLLSGMYASWASRSSSSNPWHHAELPQHYVISISAFAIQALACTIAFNLHWRIGCGALLLCVTSLIFIQSQAQWPKLAPLLQSSFGGIQIILGCSLGVLASNPNLSWRPEHGLIIGALCLAYCSFSALPFLTSNTVKHRLMPLIGLSFASAALIALSILWQMQEYWLLFLASSYSVALSIALWNWYQEIDSIPQLQSLQKFRRISYTNGAIFSILFINLLLHQIRLQLGIAY
jgi:hypothetical protein